MSNNLLTPGLKPGAAQSSDRGEVAALRQSQARALKPGFAGLLFPLQWLPARGFIPGLEQRNASPAEPGFLRAWKRES